MRTLLLVAICACVPLSPHQDASEPAPSSPAPRDDRPLRPAHAELAEAQQALDAKQFANAVAHATKAREILDAFHDRGYGSTEERDAHNQIRNEATLVGGLAYRAAGDPLAAVLFVDHEGFASDRCGEARRVQCEEHQKLIYDSETFRGLTSSYRGQSSALRPFWDESVGNIMLSTTTFEMMPNYWSSKSDYLAMWVTAGEENRYKATATGRATRHVITGAAHTLTGRDCSKKVGEIEIGGDRYDVKSCHENAYNYRGASLSFETARDGEALDLRTQEALIVFRRKSLRHKGGAYSLGEVRVVKTRPRASEAMTIRAGQRHSGQQ